MDYHKTKYRFQWWWYSEGGKETVEAVTGTFLLFGCFYTMWLIAYLLEP